jgi:hypothetical protein
MNCGSRESFHVSWRCGCSPNARQIRETALCERPSSAASERVDQCVASLGVVSSVRTITCSTCASVTVRGLPGRGSSSRPSKRSAANRERHRAAVPRETESCSAISLLLNPAAAASTIRARCASACALVRRRAHACNCSRS